jgi:hypothetical protein
MGKIVTFISELAEKAGIDPASDELKPIMSITAEMPDDVIAKINKAFIAVEDAPKNQTIKNTIIKQYGAGLMQSVEDTLKELGLSDEELKDMSKESAFGKKIDLGIRKIAELKGKPDPNASADEKALKEQIANLNKELNTFKTTHVPKEELDNALNKYESEKTDTLLEKEILRHNWSTAYTDLDIKKSVFNTKLNKFLEEKGLKISRNGDTLKIISKEGGSEYFDDKNKIVTFEELGGQLMADNKLLAVSPQTSGTQTTVLEGPKADLKGNPRAYNKTMELLRKSQADQDSNKRE